MQRFFSLLMFLLVVFVAVDAQHTEKGKASYYSDHFEGKKTASGEAYQAILLTAAHRTLPFGTKVKVTNLKNSKSVVVRINDRGPFSMGRIIDLSKSAMETLDGINDGVIDVEIEVQKEQ